MLPPGEYKRVIPPFAKLLRSVLLRVVSQNVRHQVFAICHQNDQIQIRNAALPSTLDEILQ